MRSRRAGLGIVGLAMALASCRPSAEAVADGDDPLAALAMPVQSARYDGAFWTREAHRNSRAWQAAKALCGKNRELPNCHAVELVERWEEPLRHGAPAALPALPPPPPPPPTMHPGDPEYAESDLAALKAWEARLQVRAWGSAARGTR
jgi:hypothetical protein